MDRARKNLLEKGLIPSETALLVEVRSMVENEHGFHFPFHLFPKFPVELEWNIPRMYVGRKVRIIDKVPSTMVGIIIVGVSYYVLCSLILSLLSIIYYSYDEDPLPLVIHVSHVPYYCHRLPRRLRLSSPEDKPLEGPFLLLRYCRSVCS